MTTKYLIVDANGAYAENNGYSSSEFINSSAGAGDAGKPIVLDAAGLIDSSMVDASSVSHDGTSGMAASTGHTSFPLLDGTRDFTGIQSYNSHPAFSADTDMVDKKYVDDVAAAHEWQDSVLDADILTPPGSPSSGDRYLINGVGLVGWAGKDDQIAEWNGSAWISLGSDTHVSSGNYYPFAGARDKTAIASGIEVDNFVITNADFSTQRP